ncbi:ABC transporter substrate-binding protein [Bradyrhizobium sp. 62B]|uniref:ABC transporter substrate-binding protein n=1 Tax=Bradyrhizobium sp. 62B TaxID=2898442 RepID=UPI002557D826|nr:ABC transporter substrate-binding protein [Bradyrhizobium sp. 62B]
MRRRELIGVLATMATWSLAARAQKSTGLPRIVYLDAQPTPSPWIAGLLSGLSDLGYTNGKNISLLRKQAAEPTVAAVKVAILEIRDQVDVLVVTGTISGVAAKSVTTSIPVVFISVGAPVDIGLVESLSHPGGNMTGVAFEAASETYAKRLQILKEILPNLRHVAVLGANDDPNYRFAMTSLNQIAPALKVVLSPIGLNNKNDLINAFGDMKRTGSEALLVVSGGLTYNSSQTIADLALENALPSCHGFREAVAAGGLISLGPDLVALAKQSARIIDKIIKGEQPANIPVEQPDHYRISVNLKTAKALGVTIPPALLVGADEVIE